MRKPIWVRLGLFLLPTREHAVSYVLAASVIAILAAPGTIIVMIFMYGSPLLRAVITGLLMGVALGLVVVWFWLSIRWMDTHGQWSKTNEK